MPYIMEVSPRQPGEAAERASGAASQVPWLAVGSAQGL